MGVLLDEILKPTQAPIQPQAQPQKGLLQKAWESPPARSVAAGLGKVGEALMTPLSAFGGFLKGTREEAQRRKGQGISGLLPSLGAGVKNIIPGIEQKYTPGKYLTEDVLKIPETQPIKKAVISLATDLIADPLNLLAATKLLPKTASLLGEGLKTVGKTEPVQKALQFARKTPAIYKPLEATVSPYFRNPAAGKIIEATKVAIRGRVNQLHRLVDEARQGLTPAQQARVGQLLEGGVSVSKGEQKLVNIANQFRKVAEDVGQEAMKTGLLSPESFAKYRGQYMSHIWRETTKPSGYGVISEIPKISGKFFKRRTDAEGYVREFAAPVFKGLGTEIKDIEAARMYQQLAKFGASPQTMDDFAKLSQKGYAFAEDISKTRGGKVLNKLLLPKEVIDYINKTKPTASTDIGQAYQMLLRSWKAGKTIVNPAYHVRNLVSNQILTKIQTGKGILPTVVDYVKAVRSYLGKGDQTFFREAVDSGLIKNRYFGDRVDDFLNAAFTNKSKLKKLAETPGKFQNFAEDTAKLNVFTEFRKQGKTIEEAMKLAEEAIFSPYKLGAGERGLMSSLFPFYSFTRQAAPFIGKKLLTHPERFAEFPKYERALESLTKPEKEKYLPGWMREMVRTPLKTKEGQRQYFNPQYFYPWGGFMGEEGSILSPTLGLGLNPLLEEVAAQKSGIDPYFKSKFVRPGMTPVEQTKARVSHAAQTFLPSPFRSGQKIASAVTGKEDYAGRKRGLGTTLAGELGGVRMYPFDVTRGVKGWKEQIEQIKRDTTSEVNRILKDRSLSAEQKRKKVKAIRDYNNKRLQKLLKR